MAIVLKFAEASTAGGFEAIAFLQWGQRIDGPVTGQTFPTGFAYSRSRKEAADRAANRGYALRRRHSVADLLLSKV
jgi:uncharacterized iron-regulated protein